MGVNDVNTNRQGIWDEADALKREKYFKTHYGRMFLKNSLANWFAEKE